MIQLNKENILPSTLINSKTLRRLNVFTGSQPFLIYDNSLVTNAIIPSNLKKTKAVKQKLQFQKQWQRMNRLFVREFGFRVAAEDCITPYFEVILAGNSRSFCDLLGFEPLNGILSTYQSFKKMLVTEAKKEDPKIEWVMKVRIC